MKRIQHGYDNWGKRSRLTKYVAYSCLLSTCSSRCCCSSSNKDITRKCCTCVITATAYDFVQIFLCKLFSFLVIHLVYDDIVYKEFSPLPWKSKLTSEIELETYTSMVIDTLNKEEIEISAPIKVAKLGEFVFPQFGTRMILVKIHIHNLIFKIPYVWYARVSKMIRKIRSA